MISSRLPALSRLAIAGCLAALGPRAASAAILKVPDDHATLQAAIAAAVPGADEIWVSSAGSPYVLDATLVLADGLVYRGGWDPSFLSQGSVTRLHLAVDSTGSVVDASMTTGSVTFTHFTIGPPAKPAAGITQQGAGMFVGGGSLRVASCRFENNVSVVSGGAVQVGAGSAAHFQDCTFHQNATGFSPGSGRGGAIAVGTGGDNAYLEHCRFTNYAADSAGAFSSASGGAVFLAAPVRIERCWFENNFSGTDGGALYTRNADVRGWGNLFYFNRAGRNGGGIYCQNGSGELAGTLVEDCVAGTRGAGNGGGVYHENGSNRFLDGYVRRCQALAPGGDGLTQGVGGGIYLFRPNAPAAIRGTEVVGNRAEVGGGIGIQGTSGGLFSDADITGNSIVGNFAAIASLPRMTAGGIHVLDSFLGEIVNNVISQQEDGCGIACESPFGGTQPSPNIRYNCVWNGAANPDAEYGGICADRTDLNGNIRQNPGHCCFLSPGCVPVGSSQPDLQLAAGSPCLGTGEGGVDMGARPGASGCLSPVSLENSSWGAIKARYR
jgi:predicted outer membrane repeat protein